MELTHTILDTLDRCYTGPFCEKEDWDRNIGVKVSEMLKKYGCEKSFDPENVINTEDDLADDFFKAAYDFALDTGMLCLETSRIIKVEESELKERLRGLDVLHFGKDADRIEVKPRRPEDGNKVTTALGGIGTSTSEDLWIPMHRSVAQHKVVDILSTGSLHTVYGRAPRTGTPLEFLAGIVESRLAREALRDVGRPWMPVQLVGSSMTDLGLCGAYSIAGEGATTDVPLTGTISELKTNLHYLNKALLAQQVGAKLLVMHHPMIGGYAGGPEGAALVRIAASLIIPIIYQSSITTCQCTDIRYSGNCGNTGLWADSISAQALSRNTNRVFQGQINPVAGPCTEMLLYETACHAISSVTSGDSVVVGVRSCSGRFTDYWTGLENKFAGEVIRASRGIKRSDANEILKKLMTKYKEKLRSPPKGKVFTECFDTRTLEPSSEWNAIYLKIREELADLGIPLE